MENIHSETIELENTVRTKQSMLLKRKEPENPHLNIFVNGYAYQMFIEWHEKHKNKNYHYRLVKIYLTNYGQLTLVI